MTEVPSLSDALDERALVGTFLKLPRREVVEVVALAGFDFAICDLEHGQISERDARDAVLAGLAAAIPIIVRVPSGDAGLINRLLECGAAGVQVPHVASVDAARTVRAAAYYPPAGRRSASLAQPASRYGAVAAQRYVEAANERVVAIGQLETLQYDDSLPDIIAHLDVAFVGTFDLSVEAGCPGSTTDARVRAVIAEIERAAASRSAYLGAYAASTAEARQQLDRGYRLIAVSSDVSMLVAKARADVAELKEGGRD